MRRATIILLLLYTLASHATTPELITGPESGVFADCIAHYASGESGWCKLSDDVFDNVRLSDVDANAVGVRGSIGSKAVMIAWNGGVLDPDSLTMYFHGGGHNDYYGNEWYAYDIQAGAFERLNDPSPLTHYYYDPRFNKYCLVPDPSLAPMSTHTYDGVEFNLATGTIILIAQRLSNLCGSEPMDKTLIDKAQVNNLYEFNPSKTEIRNGLDPLTYRNLGGRAYSHARSTIINGQLILGSNKSLSEYGFSAKQAVEGPEIFKNPAAGQGIADTLNGEVVTYLNAGFLWTFDDSGSTRHISNYSRIPNAGGMACGVTECLFWAGGQNVTIWKRENSTTYTEVEHSTGPTNGDARVYSKLQYIPGYDVYIGVSNINQPVWLYRVDGTVAQSPAPAPGPEPNPDTEAEAVMEEPEPDESFANQSPTPEPESQVVVEATGPGEGSQESDLALRIEGSGPFHLGVGIPKGATDQPSYPNAQAVCRVSWNDGSCKFAVVAGYAGEGEPVASPSSISVDIDGLIVEPGIPFYTETGPYMTESWYREKAGDLLVLFYVQEFSRGEQHVTVAVENGYVNLNTGQEDYNATVTVGEQTETYQISHARNTRWVAEFYQGQFAKARQNVNQLMESGLVPNYPLSPNATPGGYQEYAPMEKGDHTAKMGATGYQPQIGLLPKWDAAYLANPSEEAYASVIANAYAIGSYRIVWRDADTGGIIEPAKFGKWTVAGENQGGATQVCGNDLCWERAHFPSTGYLAYLLTGNPVHLDTLGHTASSCYLVQSWSYGGGIGEARLDRGQTRGQAWCWRAAGMYAAMAGDSGVKNRLAFNMAHYVKRTDDNELGISFYDRAYGTGRTGPWQQNFRVQTLGFLSDIEPLDDMSDLIALRDFNYKFPVGLLQDKYCRAGKYTLQVGDSDMTGLAFWTWDQIDLGASCAGELDAPSATDYWANLLPAISYAVKHKALGADESWGRVKNASNFDWWMGLFDDNPVWGIAFAPQFSAEEARNEPTYASDDYLTGWSDFYGTCIDTRNVVLAIESIELPTFDEDGCTVTAGLWQDPYTGETFTDPGDLVIDHLVPLREAHDSGARFWEQERKRAYANDTILADVLVAVGADTYLSKGDNDPVWWMPPDPAFRCEYVRDWVAVKNAYGLDFDIDEIEAIEAVLGDDLQHATRLTQNGTYLNSEESAAFFAIGLTRDNGCAYYTEATTQNLVDISVSITPDAQHIGKELDIFLIAQIGTQLYSVSPATELIAVDTVPEQLIAFSSGVFWETYEFTVYKGYLGTLADMQIFVAYRPDGGELVYTPKPLKLTVY